MTSSFIGCLPRTDSSCLDPYKAFNYCGEDVWIPVYIAQMSDRLSVVMDYSQYIEWDYNGQSCKSKMLIKRVGSSEVYQANTKPIMAGDEFTFSTSNFLTRDDLGKWVEFWYLICPNLWSPNL